ncbi:Bcpfy1 [Botrytis cinerea B05.10]|uniref:Profilin n=3 Tax=Botryotinia fuckeliana TaxID=40559 RepID=A0A384J3X2_BOTFB|nr:Bcpfy1 [Botrytis cinerea B05.10]ATZ45216.1 Bcpfy1 [Botrytis cinerea B05.10]CCD55612.1 similar to profilin [Botrytis cinerea T4]
MSWQAYIDTSLCGSGHVEKGAIYNLEGTSCWATSPDFAITPEEMAEVKNGLDGKTDSLYANGLHIAKDRYVLTKVEDDNKMLYARKGKDGLVIGKTVQAIIVARYVDPMIAGNTAETVQKLVDYLVKVGY